MCHAAIDVPQAKESILKQTGVDHTLEERYNFGGNINEQEQTCECPNGAPQSLSSGCPS
jgi:hypothetical protein